jgi:hypothetical protein
VFTLFLLAAATCIACAGWGLAFRQMAAPLGKLPDVFAPSDHALLGVFALTALAIAGNFFLPLTGSIGVFTIGLGGAICAAWFVHNRSIGATTKYSFAAMLVCALYFSFRLINYRFQYDTGLYHMPFLMWVAESSAPFGLVNLENRLGFNSSWLMFHAALRLPFAGWGSVKVVECVAWVLAIWVLYDGLSTRWRGFGLPNGALVAAVALVLFAHAFVLGPNDVASTDNAPNIFALLAAIFFLECSEAMANGNQPQVQRGLLLLVTASCLAVAGKLAMSPVAMLPLAAITMAARGEGGIGRVAIPLATGMIFMCCWLVRNVFLTGCLAYPVAVTCVETLSWSAGTENAATMSRAITDWANAQLPASAPGAATGEWLWSWTRLVLASKPVLLFMFLAGIGLWLALSALRGGPELLTRLRVLRNLQFLLVGAVATCGIAFLAVAAPAVRFGWSYLLLCLVPIYAVLFAQFGPARLVPVLQRIARRKTFRIGAAVLVTLMLTRGVLYADLAERVTPPDADFRSKAIPNDGSQVNVLISGDLCWDTPRPCTPSLNSEMVVDTLLGRPRFTIHK